MAPKLWPQRKTLPLWRQLLDAGNDAWVANGELLRGGHDISPSSLCRLLHRWTDRGWLERRGWFERRRAESDDRVVSWRLTLHGRTQVRLMIDDDERERAISRDRRTR
jgi:hypothetical protein